MNDLKLIEVIKDYEIDILSMLKEIEAQDKNAPWQYAGMASIEKFANFSDWLDKITKESIGESLLPNRVPATTYILVRNSDNKVLGMYNIRHDLNDFLLTYGGHIGYSIRPSERKKGYGTIGLKLALEETKKLDIKRVLITCNTKNIASSKVIENCGGILENTVVKADEELKRYWINN